MRACTEEQADHRLIYDRIYQGTVLWITQSEHFCVPATSLTEPILAEGYRRVIYTLVFLHTVRGARPRTKTVPICRFTCLLSVKIGVN